MSGFTHHKPEGEEVWVNVSNRTIVRVLLMVIVSLLFLLAVRKAAHALILIFTAFFLALALNTPVHWLAEHLPGKLRGNRMIATAISFLVVIIILGTFLASIIPPLVRQTDNFIKQAPHLVQDVRNQNSSLGNIVRKYHLQSQVNSFAQQLGVRLQHAAGTAVSGIGHLAKSAFSVLAILALTFMMVIEGPTQLKRIRSIMPAEYRAHTDHLAHDMYSVIRGYVNGQVLLAIIAASLITPALFILHISYPLALLVVIFICGLIPLVGHSIGAVIVTIVALFHSPISALIILIYYIFYQQIETYVIQPRIQADSTNLTPLLVFTAVVVGVNFGGLFGGLFAIPVAGCIRVLFVDYWHSRGKLLTEPATISPPTEDTKG
jgi:predicted PurR-regulated permease PerM